MIDIDAMIQKEIENAMEMQMRSLKCAKILF